MSPCGGGQTAVLSVPDDARCDGKRVSLVGIVSPAGPTVSRGANFGETDQTRVNPLTRGRTQTCRNTKSLRIRPRRELRGICAYHNRGIADALDRNLDAHRVVMRSKRLRWPARALVDTTIGPLTGACRL